MDENDDFCLHCGNKGEAAVHGDGRKKLNHVQIVAIAAGILGIAVSLSGFFLADAMPISPGLHGDAAIGTMLIGVFLSAVGIAAPFAADTGMGARMMYLAGIGIFFYSFLLGLAPAVLFLIGGRLLSRQA